MNIITKTLCAALTLMTLLSGQTASAAELPSLESADQVGVAAAVDLEGQLNVNTASAEQLELLPGIGPAIAQRIVTYRDKRPFKALNHVMRVKGIGNKTYAKIKPYLSLEGDNTLKIAG